MGDEVRCWQEGRVVTIDSTHEHEVWNKTDQKRLILLGEFRRLDMPKAVRILDCYPTLFNWTPIGRQMLRRTCKRQRPTGPASAACH